MSEQKLVLIDAMALVFRSHFAFIKNPRVTSTGINTSALFGFANSLMEVLTKQQPTHIGVAFESKVPTIREEEYAAYKANREETPEDIKLAVPMVMDLLKALRIPILEVDRYEADDVIGTLAWQSAEAGVDCYMMTPDKDYAQLVKEHVFLLRPASKFAPTEILDTEGIKAKFSVRPDQIADFLGLKGDAVDNIPGIPKIGDKTAVQLLTDYDNLENIIANVGAITKKSVKATIEEHSEQGILSKRLATIFTDAPIQLDLEALKHEEPDKELLEALLTKWEFRTMAKRLLGEEITPKKQKEEAPNLFSSPAPSAKKEEVVETSPFTTLAEVKHDYQLVDTDEKRKALIKQLEKQKWFCFDTETTDIDALKAQVVGLAISWEKGKGWYVPFPDTILEAKALLEEFQPVFADEAIGKVAQNIKYDLAVLGNYGISVKGELFDTMLAHYVCHSHLRHNMDILANNYLDYQPVSITTLIGKKGKGQLNMRDVPVEQVAEYAPEDADITWQLYQKLEPEVKKEQVERVFYEVEMPLVPILEQMERDGITVDVNFLADYSKELGNDLGNLEAEIYRLSEEKFNINSPKQLGEIMFDKLQIGGDKPKKTKTGQYKTDEEVLNGLAAQGYDLPARILEYRELNKLKSTYVDAIPELVDARTGRVHTSYNQAVAITGRLSSNNPNLQNIPIRTSRGREIRKAFTAPSDDYLLLSADYSQIELRVMAAMSQDKHMMQAFQDNADIHTATAARVFGVSAKEVDREMRSKAKMVNFGIIYGITPFGLSQRLGIARGEAKDIIDSYFEQYPGVKTYMDDCITRAKESGYAYTLFGRRHLLRDINSSNGTVRSFAERNAINTPIQGSAADMIKVAMVKVYNELNASGLRAKMLLQVHDELVFEVHKDDAEALKPLVTDGMQNAVKLDVPILVETGTGPTGWMRIEEPSFRQFVAN